MSWHNKVTHTSLSKTLKSISHHLTISLSYFAFLATSSWLSNLLETAPQSSAIYLPAGVKLAFALVVPTRYWLTLWLVSRLYASYQGIFYTGEWNIDLFHNIWQELFFYTLVYIFKTSRWPPGISSNREVLSTLVLATFTSGFKWFLFASSFEFTTWLQGQQLLQYQLNMTLGDLTGSLLVIPLVYLLVVAWKRKSFTGKVSYLNLCLALCLLAILSTFLYLSRPDIYSLLRLASLLPIIWFSYQFGIVGAVISAFAVNGLIVTEAALTQEANNTYISQLFILANAITSLVLGTAITELKQKNATLLSTNQKLQDLLKKNEKLAIKMVTVQENERKHLSQELHDELGQNLTALITELSVLASISEEQTRPHVRAIKSNAHSMYESVYDLMHYLRPRELDELGLEQALQKGQFKALLRKANVEYITELQVEKRKRPVNHTF